MNCELVSRGPNPLSHDEGPCHWPSLAGVRPDCGQDGENCTFFSEEKNARVCSVRDRVVKLCGGPNSEGEDMLRSPVFLAELGPPRGAHVSSPAAGAAKSGLPSLGDYCHNWNLRIGKRCNSKPSEGCKKRHRCMVCNGEHRQADCSRRE